MSPSVDWDTLTGRVAALCRDLLVDACHGSVAKQEPFLTLSFEVDRRGGIAPLPSNHHNSPNPKGLMLHTVALTQDRDICLIFRLGCTNPCWGGAAADFFHAGKP